MIRIFCVGDDKNKLESLRALVNKVIPFAIVETSTSLDDVCLAIDKKEYNAVLTESKTENFDGLKLARFIHDISPFTKVIFVTKNSEYAVPAFKTRANGYLLGELSETDLKEELKDLGIGFDTVLNHRLEAKTFGNFELLCDGNSIKFERAKSKELIAYLVDKKGTSASSSELIVNLWEDRDVDRTTRSMLHNLIADIRATFTKYGILDVLDIKHNAFRINEKNIDCDYYKVLNGDEQTKRQFMGEYMSNYSWAEFTSALLSKMCNKF